MTMIKFFHNSTVYYCFYLSAPFCTFQLFSKLTYYVFTIITPYLVSISKMETTTFSFNSPLSKIFFKCFDIAGILTSKSCAIFFWGSHIVSFRNNTSTLISPFGDLYSKNSASLSLFFNS